MLGVYADYYVFETTLKEQPEEEEETLGADTVSTVDGCMVQLHVESHYTSCHHADLALASLSCSIVTTLVEHSVIAGSWNCVLPTGPV